MKRIFVVLFIIFLLGGLTSCSMPRDGAGKSADEPMLTPLSVKAVWITYYELQELLNNRDETAFSAAVSDAFTELAAWGFNTVTVHVRPCADAFYRSSYFPSSEYCFGRQGSDMPYDPLAILCEAAHENGLKIEAWVNPYRVSQHGDIASLCDSNIAVKWYNDEEKKSSVYVTESGIYFNPAADGVTDLIVKGVTELVENYDVDAIHFDDYFYPSAEEAVDSAEYEEYCADGGSLSLSDYRREVVSNMVKAVYEAVKSADSTVLFGISPAADMQRNFDALYADTVMWATEKGYVDYIVPQIYFGFLNEAQPFMKTVKRWRNTAKCPLYIGLPLYKSGKKDAYASVSNEEAVNEFIDNHNIIARQITYLTKSENVNGFYLFSYGCLHDERCAEEVKNLLQAMQSSNPEQLHNAVWLPAARGR